MTLTTHTPPAQGRRWLSITTKSVLAVLCLMMAAMWVYYFFFASDQGVYQLSDASWRTTAKPICEAAQAERAALADTEGGYIENPTVEQMVQRADIVDSATNIIERMLDDIMAIPVATDRDRALLKVFDENYRIIIGDRRRYAAQLRAGNLVAYSETVVAGGPVSNVVLDFTAGVKGNDVPSCSPPGELGGDIRT
ncbi:MAG: hypothetical protein RLZ14_1692 [Actinomycetota bacterium]|jgi:hypothetical protein